jgi:serine/threonine protein phosphatase PrpC
MLENLKVIYAQYRWAKLVTCLLLVGAGYLLFQLAGGFPPWAWRFLFNVLPRLTSLWTTQGSGVLLPFIGLLLLSLSLLILWVVIVLGISQSIVLFWQHADQEEGSQPALDRYTLPMEKQMPPPYQAPMQSGYEMQFAPTQAGAYENYVATNGSSSQSFNSQDYLAHFTDDEDEATDWVGTNHTAMGTAPTQPPYVQGRRNVQLEPANRAYEPEPSSHRSRPRIPPVPTTDIPTPTRTSQSGRTTPSRTRSRPHIPPIPPDSNPAGQDFMMDEEEMISPQTMETDQALQKRQTQQSQLTLQSRQFQQSLSQQIQGLGGAVPTYDPIPRTTRPGMRHKATLHGHLRLISEEIEPTHNSYLDDAFNEFIEDDDIETSRTRPIQEDEDKTKPVPTSWNDENDEQEATLRLVVGTRIDPGLVRKDRPNEDSLFAIQGVRTTQEGPIPAGLFVIADGMGGHANGREASRLAVRSISDIIVPALLRDDTDETQDTGDEQEILLNLLKDGVHRANLAIYQRNRDLPDMMGTTITTALVVNTTAYVVNVGDSRTYLYRAAEGLVPITRDHSTVARLVEAGQIKRDEIYTHPQRNEIYRCLGEHATIEMDTFVVQLQPDDILLLCSDGLWEMVRDPAMEKIIASSSHLPAQISNILVQAALSQGGVDNISVVVVGVVKTTL